MNWKNRLRNWPNSIWFMGVTLWSLFILYALFKPASEIPEVPLIIPHLDKAVHFTLFAVEGFLLVALFKGTLLRFDARGKWGWSLLFMFLVICSAGSEYLQEHYTLDRSGDLFDAVADLLGGIIGALCATFFFTTRD